MQKTVTGRHIKLTPSLREYVENKLFKQVERVFDDSAAKLEVALDDSTHRQHGLTETCRIHLVMPLTKPVIIEEHDDNMYKAIDRAHDRLLEQVKQRRDRLRDGHHRRKVAAKERALTARYHLTSQPEEWERETALYEATLPSMG